MPRLAKVPTGKVKFGRQWFANVVDRIEEIKPIQAGGNSIIQVLPTSDGQQIVLKAKAIDVTICEDGQPKTISILQLL